jgi:hypothetical protein
MATGTQRRKSGPFNKPACEPVAIAIDPRPLGKRNGSQLGTGRGRGARGKATMGKGMRKKGTGASASPDHVE